jgi:hypothetical protein
MAGMRSRAPADRPAARRVLATSGTGALLDNYATPQYVVVDQAEATATKPRFPPTLLHKDSACWIGVSGKIPLLGSSVNRGNGSPLERALYVRWRTDQRPMFVRSSQLLCNAAGLTSPALR